MSPGADEYTDDDHDLERPSPKPWGRRLLGILAVLLIVGVYLLFYLPIATWLLWGSGLVWGVPAMIVAFDLLAGPGIFLAWRLRKRSWPIWAVAPLVVAALGASAIGLRAMVPYTAPPPWVLAPHLDGLGVPHDWRFVDERRSLNANCYDTCPSVCRWYQVDGDISEAVKAGAEWFSAKGYPMKRTPYEKQGSFAGSGWHQELTVEVDVRSSGRNGATREQLVEVCLSGREVP